MEASQLRPSVTLLSSSSANAVLHGRSSASFLAFTSTGGAVTSSKSLKALVVVAAKGKRGNMPYGRKGTAGQQQMPSMPEFDPKDDTPRFVLFIKSKVVNRWYPLSIVTGGTTAKLMVGAMKNQIGKSMYEGALTRNIAAVMYKDERALIQSAIRQYPMLKGAAGYDYGYKIMDPQNPRSSVIGSEVTKIPPQEELKSVVDKARDFFGDKLGSLKESFGSISSSPISQLSSSQSQAEEGKTPESK